MGGQTNDMLPQVSRVKWLGERGGGHGRGLQYAEMRAGGRCVGGSGVGGGEGAGLETE